MKVESQLSAEQQGLIDKPIDFVQAHFQDSEDIAGNSAAFEQAVRKLLFKEASDDDAMIDEGEAAVKKAAALAVELPNVGSLQDGALQEQHHKLVRFDCMVQDQYDDEYYYAVMESGADKKKLVYKYFSELDASDRYDVADQTGQTLCERGSMRGTTMQSFAPWLQIE